MLRLITFFILIWISFIVIALAGPLHDATEKGDVNKVKELIAEGSNVNEKDSGNLPLEIASYYGHADIVRVLVSNGAYLSTDALLLASRKGHKEIVEFLISKGMDVNSKDEKYGPTPIFLATIYGHKNLVEFLINKRADIDVRNKWGRTPLYSAVVNNRTNITEFLINNGANRDIRNDKGSTLLHMAVYENNKEMAELLLSKSLNPNEKNANEKTPLHIAVEFGFMDIAKLLKEHGAKETTLKKFRAKEFPFSITSNSWSLNITALKSLQKKEFDYWELWGMSGSISDLISTPDLSSGSIPLISMKHIGNGKTSGWRNRSGTISESYVLVSLNISIKNKLNKQLSLRPNDVRLKNEDGFLNKAPLSFKIEKQPIYKNFSDGESPIYFPPKKQYVFEFLYILPKKLKNMVIIIPTMDAQNVEITKEKS